MKEAGIDREKLPETARTAINDGSAMFNPEDLEYQDALKVLEKAYA